MSGIGGVGGSLGGPNSSPVETDTVPRRTVSEMSGIVGPAAVVGEMLEVVWGPAPTPPHTHRIDAQIPLEGIPGRRKRGSFGFQTKESKHPLEAIGSHGRFLSEGLRQPNLVKMHRRA